MVEIKTPTREEKLANSIKGIKMAALPAICGIAAGILSSPYVLSEGNSGLSIIVLVIFIYAQKFIFPFIGIDSSKFKLNDWLFITFMTAIYWFLVWTIILTGLDGKAPSIGPLF